MLDKFYLLRELKTEFSKYRRTMVYWLMILCPFAIVFFVFTVNHWSLPQSLTKAVAEGNNPWEKYITIHYRVLNIMLLPIYMAMITGVIYGREHRNNTWKHLYALPVPQWSIELSKNLFTLIILALTLLIFAVFVLLSGYIISMVNPKLNLAQFDNNLGFNLMLACKSFLCLFGIWAIHNWVGRRFNSFGYNIGLALVGAISSGVLIQGWKYVKYYPYAFPSLGVLDGSQMHTFFSKPVIYSLIVGVVCWAIGFWDIQRRTIQA